MGLLDLINSRFKVSDRGPKGTLVVVFFLKDTL